MRVRPTREPVPAPLEPVHDTDTVQLLLTLLLLTVAVGVGGEEGGGAGVPGGELVRGMIATREHFTDYYLL